MRTEEAAKDSKAKNQKRRGHNDGIAASRCREEYARGSVRRASRLAGWWR